MRGDIGVVVFFNNPSSDGFTLSAIYTLQGRMIDFPEEFLDPSEKVILEDREKPLKRIGKHRSDSRGKVSLSRTS